jgi:hypothetical protein
MMKRKLIAIKRKDDAMEIWGVGFRYYYSNSITITANKEMKIGIKYKVKGVTFKLTKDYYSFHTRLPKRILGIRKRTQITGLHLNLGKEIVEWGKYLEEV